MCEDNHLPFIFSKHIVVQAHAGCSIGGNSQTWESQLNESRNWGEIIRKTVIIGIFCLLNHI